GWCPIMDSTSGMRTWCLRRSAVHGWATWSTRIIQWVQELRRRTSRGDSPVQGEGVSRLPRLGEEFHDRPFRGVVFAFAGVRIPDGALSVDQVERWPVDVLVGVLDLEVVVHHDRVPDALTDRKSVV